MEFDRIAENRIREAIAQGEFDNLPNQGQPLNLDEYFKMPEHLRMAYTVLKNANCVPEEVALLNEIAGLERQLDQAKSDNERTAVEQRIQDMRLRLRLMLELRK